jgi:formylglycine-generating enzyme required for sulfatase activity
VVFLAAATNAGTPPDPACGATVPVPAGDFWMGSDQTDPERAPDEQPRHRVSLDAYDIDVHEVSTQCYERSIEAIRRLTAAAKK